MHSTPEEEELKVSRPVSPLPSNLNSCPWRPFLPTLGALFPRGGPVQDPVLTSKEGHLKSF